MTWFPSVGALLGALLTGCTVGPDYQPPQSALEDSYSPLPKPAATQPSGLTTRPVQITQWWATLNDPTLDALIDQSVRANLDLRLATARIREARARYRIAGAAQYPSVDTRAGYSRNRSSQNAAPFNAFDVPGFPWEYDLYQVGFDASWELDVFGGVRRSTEAARADLAASVEERRSVLLSILAEVARNYVELRGLQQQYQIAQRNLAVQRQTLELTVEQRKKGTATQLDVSRAAAQVASTEAVLPRLQGQQRQAIHRLSLLVGKQPGVLVDALSAVRPIPVPPAEIPTGVPADLLRRRPDIRRAERELAAATARVGAAVAELYPRFSLTGSFAFQSSQPGDLFNGDSRSFSNGPALRWPIFDAGRLRAGVQVRSAQQEQALSRYEMTVLEAMAEMHDAMVSFITEQDRRRALGDAVSANRESLELASELYRQGLTDFTTVLDAERQLYQSQSDLAESERLVTTSLIALHKAMGGGWEIELLPQYAPLPPKAKKPRTPQP